MPRVRFTSALLALCLLCATPSSASDGVATDKYGLLDTVGGLLRMEILDLAVGFIGLDPREDDY